MYRKDKILAKVLIWLDQPLIKCIKLDMEHLFLDSGDVAYPFMKTLTILNRKARYCPALLAGSIL